MPTSRPPLGYAVAIWDQDGKPALNVGFGSEGEALDAARVIAAILRRALLVQRLG